MVAYPVVQSAVDTSPFKIDEGLLGTLPDKVNDLDLS